MAEDQVSEEELEPVEGGQESPAEGEETKSEGEEVIPEEVSEEEEVVPEEPDHDEKSRLGRRVKRMEDGFETLIGKIDNFLDIQKPQVQEEEIDEDMPLTYGDLNSYLDTREKSRVNEDRNYFDNYTTALVDLSKDLSDDVAKAVFKEHDEHYIKRANLDPNVAAHINFLEAKSAVLSKLLVSEPVKHNPLKGKRVDLPSGTSGGSRMKGKEDTSLGLDEETKSLIKELGLTEEQAKDALSEESSTLKVKE